MANKHRTKERTVDGPIWSKSILMWHWKPKRTRQRMRKINSQCIWVKESGDFGQLRGVKLASCTVWYFPRHTSSSLIRLEQQTIPNLNPGESARLRSAHWSSRFCFWRRLNPAAEKEDDCQSEIACSIIVSIWFCGLLAAEHVASFQ